MDTIRCQIAGFYADAHATKFTTNWKPAFDGTGMEWWLGDIVRNFCMLDLVLGGSFDVLIWVKADNS